MPLPQSDASGYVGPPGPSDVPQATYPRWMYSPTLPPVIVENLSQQLALGSGYFTTPQAPLPVPTVASTFIGTFATLAALNSAYSASVLTPGMTALTGDQGWVAYSASLGWQAVAAPPARKVLSVVNRFPSVTDNATLGYTTNSVWQQGGTVHTPSTYCANDSAAWAPIAQSPVGTPVDIMGTTVTKFAGGTCAMLKAYVGAAIDVAVTVGGVYSIATINILANGELDNVSLGALMAQADANTNAKVLKLYDQTGNGNHATLANAAGIPVFAASATVSTATTLTINSGQTGTIAVGQTVYGNNIPTGITVSAGAGPYTLSGSGAPLNPATIAVYFGITSPPYVDWDPIMGRYMIFSANEVTNGGTTNKRALQLPQAMTFTSTQNIGVFAVGMGLGSNDGQNPALCALGDTSIGAAAYVAILGSINSPPTPSVYGQISFNQLGINRTVPVATDGQPSVLIASTTSAPLSSLSVNEQSGSSSGAIANSALAGGWLFAYGGNALLQYSMMKLVGIAMFNAAPTAAQSKAMRYGAYSRFNIYPQVPNQIALVGDSRFCNNFVQSGFGASTLLARYIGRNWRIINLGISGSTIAAQIGDGLVPTVTGAAKSLQTLKAPGLNYALILMGVNDFGNSSKTVAQTIANLQIECAQITAAGWTPIVISELATTETTGSNPAVLMPQFSAQVNALGPSGMGAAAIVNMQGYVPVITPSNVNYYSDGLHPTLPIHLMVASASATALTALVGPSV